MNGNLPGLVNWRSLGRAPRTASKAQDCSAAYGVGYPSGLVRPPQRQIVGDFNEPIYGGFRRSAMYARERRCAA
jgi:hypothetical protein